MLLLLFGIVIVFVFIANSQKVTSVRADFNFKLKFVAFTIDEDWESIGSIYGDISLDMDLLCKTTKTYLNNDNNKFKNIRFTNGLSKNTEIELTHLHNNMNLFLDLPGSGDAMKNCSLEKERAKAKGQFSKKDYSINFNDKFYLSAEPLISKNSSCESLNKNCSETSLLQSKFSPVLINQLSFIEKSIRDKYNETHTQRLIRESGNIIYGEIHLPFYDKKIVLEEGQIINLEIKRAHILKLTSSKEGIELRGVAELTNIEMPSYSYLTGDKARDDNVSLLPTYLDYMVKSSYFNVLSGLLGVFISVLGLFELWGLNAKNEK